MVALSRCRTWSKKNSYPVLVTFLGHAVSAYKHSPLDVQKSRRRVRKPSPEVPWNHPGESPDTPRDDRKGSEQIEATPLGAKGAPRDAPDTSRGRLGDILGPPGPHLGENFDPKTCLGTPQRGLIESERWREKA